MGKVKNGKSNASSRRVSSGRKVQPKPTPPVLTQGGWWNGHVVVSGIGNFDLTVKGLVELFCEQNGLYSSGTKQSVSVAVRLERLHLYCISSYITAEIGCVIYDVTHGGDSKNEPLTRLSAAPAKDEWARLGYQFPERIRDDSLVDADTTVLATVYADNGISWRLYVYLNWRARNAAGSTTLAMLRKTSSLVSK